MKQIAGNLLGFTRQTKKRDLLLIAGPLILLTSINYTYGIESRLISIHSFALRFSLCFLLYVVVYSGSMIIVLRDKVSEYLLGDRFLLILLFAAPAIFAWKWSSGMLVPVTNQGISRFVAIIANPLLKCGILMALVYWLKHLGKYPHRLDGLKFRDINLKPFVLAVVLFAPVVLYFASTPAFQETYPRLERVRFMMDKVSRPWIAAIIFELSYAFDFIFVEVFFRGFLILAFIRYGGEKVILPMAALYCAIHFGKPLAECISSFFGGILLGVISYHSRSIAGGLLLHLGIGWLMEIAGLIWSK